MPYNVDIGYNIYIEGVQVMEDGVVGMLGKIETNIERCEILSDILAHKSMGRDMDINKYMEMGYSEEEIVIGLDIINIYLGLLSLVEQINVLV